ncbi:NUDIX hydrolase [Yaniella halotolerans]|uniref:NUDIX hydrolase n=1 Tax=Yaniella halotolerans TaxID=225453 RepID=UPI00041009FC|nr:NUDIX domain-containing protein [Yaniella halotolerans]
MDEKKFNSMARPELTHPYVASKQAASVIMVRQASGGELEVYVQHRATTMDFAAGAVVFPGGRTDAEDALFTFEDDVHSVVLDHVHGWQRTSLGSDNRDTAFSNSSMMLRTGLREVEEETGVGLHPHLLRPWGNLITPVGYPKRFDTFFFLATPDEDVLPENITTEAVHADWHSIESLLEDAEQGRIALMRPTKFLLLDIFEQKTIDDLLGRDPIVQPIRGI